MGRGAKMCRRPTKLEPRMSASDGGNYSGLRTAWLGHARTRLQDAIHATSIALHAD
jgi:hypothetical protein